MKQIKTVLALIAYMAAFLYGYAVVVAPVFSYAGFTFDWPGSGTIAFEMLMGLVPSFFMPQRISKPSVLILWWLYLSTYIPAMLVPVISLKIPQGTLLPLQFSVLCCMLLLCAIPNAKTLVLPNVTITPHRFWYVFGFFWLIGFALVLKTFSLGKILVNLGLLLSGESEYTLRGDFFDEIAQSGGRAIGYVGGLLAQALDPFLLAYGLIYRKAWLFLLGAIGQLLLFGLAGPKGVLFSIGFIAFIYFFSLRYRDNFGLSFVVVMTLLLVACTALDLWRHTPALSTTFTRRTLAGPGLLTGFYFEHYSLAPHPGHIFVHGGSDQAYGPPQEIGAYYFSSDRIDANANSWAEGFAEYGIPGIFGFNAVIALMLWLYDSIARTRPMQLGVVLCIMIAEALSNGSALTILVTHGGLAVAALLYFSPGDPVLSTATA